MTSTDQINYDNVKDWRERTRELNSRLKRNSRVMKNMFPNVPKSVKNAAKNEADQLRQEAHYMECPHLSRGHPCPKCFNSHEISRIFPNLPRYSKHGTKKKARLDLVANSSAAQDFKDGITDASLAWLKAG